MDIRQLSFDARSFDVAIDKGTRYTYFYYRERFTMHRNNGCDDDRYRGRLGD